MLFHCPQQEPVDHRQYRDREKLCGIRHCLKMAKDDGSYIKEIVKIERQHLLIPYDFGIHPFDAQSRAAEDRHGKTLLIITSQLPVSKWHEVIGEKTIADATLDRNVHDAHRVELRGESIKKNEK